MRPVKEYVAKDDTPDLPRGVEAANWRSAANGLCPTCGPTAVEQHPRRPAVTRCANCKEWLRSTENDAYVGRANEVERIAQIIVSAGCKPYSAAAALVDAGYANPPEVTP
jgi:hypothetical protein